MSNFVKATIALNDGKRVRRHFWPAERKFIFMQVPATINAEIVPKMQSLPQTVKNYFQHTFEDESEQIASIYYHDQLAEVGLSNSIISYSPSVEDVFAQDWVVLDID